MVLGLLSAIVAAPAIVGTTEAVRAAQQQQAREQHRGRKSELLVSLPRKNSYSQRFDGCRIVLRASKLYIETTLSAAHGHDSHPFAGYYLPHPNASRWKGRGWVGEGFVSTVSDDPPILNWIYVDKDTYAVRYGVRAQAEPHYCGPWDCTKLEKRVTFEGWEGFVAVQEDEGRDVWGLFFDKMDDGLKGKGHEGKRMLEVVLRRGEMAKGRCEAEQERSERLAKLKDKEKEVLENAVVA